MNFAFIAEPWSIWAWLCNRLGVPRLVWDRLPAIPILAGARAQRFPSDLCENLDPKSRLLAGAVRVESAVRSADCAGPASPGSACHVLQILKVCNKSPACRIPNPPSKHFT
jgi:hypothetical protein